MQMPSHVVRAIALSLVATAVLAEDTKKTLTFKACPIVRDTSTVPCWLAEHEGELYYLGIQTDLQGSFTPPYLGHQALIEGEVTDRRICGGVVLEPVRASTLPEMDANCSTILPAEDQYQIDFNPRPPGPSVGRYALPPAQRQRRAPAPVVQRQEFQMQFEFDGRVKARNAGDLNRIFNYVQAAKASKISIVGAQGGALLSNGQRMDERPELAKARAEEVANLLRQAGLQVRDWSVSWNPPAVPDGREDWADRRVTVVVEQ
jgi:hypothetical protein